jgi:hypothetical protein
MKHDLEQLQSTGASSADQVLTKQDALSQHISNISDVARCHEDEIDDTRAAQNFTHELVLEREQKGSR